MRLRYLAREIKVLERPTSLAAAYMGSAAPPEYLARRPRTRTYPAGLVDVDVFPELEPWCDPREIETRDDGCWRFKAKDA